MAQAAGAGGGLHAYVVRRLLLALPVLFGVSLLVFGVLHLAPGDPAAIMLGAQATREDVERLRRDLGLDQPLPVQYVRWLGHVLRGDLGRSIPLGREVLPEVLLRFKATLILTGGALVIAVVIGVPAGIVSATRQYSWLDKLSMGVAVTGVSLPVFWTGIMLIIVFALVTPLAALGGDDLALRQLRRARSSLASDPAGGDARDGLRGGAGPFDALERARDHPPGLRALGARQGPRRAPWSWAATC